MKIKYTEILKKNMLNVLKDILIFIKNEGLHENNVIYITFETKNNKVIIPDWLKKKYPKEMTIIIQYEYWGLEIKENSFIIGLSFNDIRTYLDIPYDSIISFADPNAKFGLQLVNTEEIENITKKKKITNKKNNVINFNEYKKN